MKKTLCYLLTTLALSCGSKEIITIDERNVAAALEEKPLPSPTEEQTTLVLPDVSKMTSVASTLKFLAADELKGRETGTQGVELAAQFIEARFENAGVAPFYESYRDSFTVKDKTAFNVIGVLEGSDPKLKDDIIIIGAHYDHIGYGKPIDGDVIANGANDNASGTTAVLTLADHFAKAKTNKRTLVFVLFAAEEKGLQGSKHLAQKMKAANANIYAVVNIEMIGVPMLDTQHTFYVTGYNLSNFPKKFNEYSRSKVVGYLPKAQEYNLFKRSDNYPFYQEFGIPAHTLSTFDFTNFDHYHGVNDEADQLDIEFMGAAIKKLIPGINGMANSLSREVHMIK